MSICVIDADLIAFKASAACETRWIEVIHTPSGESKEFGTVTRWKQWLKEHPRWDEKEFVVERKREPEPLPNCLHTVKAMINRIYLDSKCDDLKVVIGG